MPSLFGVCLNVEIIWTLFCEGSLCIFVQRGFQETLKGANGHKKVKNN